VPSCRKGTAGDMELCCSEVAAKCRGRGERSTAGGRFHVVTRGYQRGRGESARRARGGGEWAWAHPIRKGEITGPGSSMANGLCG